MIEVMIGVFSAIGIIVSIVGGIMFLTVAFRESFLWGLGCFLFLPVSLGFLISRWAAARKSFFIMLGGWSFIILGVLLRSLQ